MKVIQINCIYEKGSTGKIVDDIHRYLKNKMIDSIVCYGRGKKVHRNNIYKVSSELEAKVHSLQSKLFGVEFSHSPIATKKMISIIENEKPDIVHLHCLNGHFINVYKLIEYLKDQKIQTVLTLHAEIMHTAGCEHAIQCEKWKSHCYSCNYIHGYISHYFRDDARYCFDLMERAIDQFETLTTVAVSDWLKDRAYKSAIFKGRKEKIVTIHNGVNTDVFYPRKQKKYLNKEEYDRKKPIILHVTPNFYHPLKGGSFIIEIARSHPEWQIVIVGVNGSSPNFPTNVITIDKTNNQEELAQLYSDSNVTVIASKRETFSMVCAESLCCGTPVVGFKCGGPESIFQNEFCHFVEYGRIDSLCDQIESVLQKKTDSIKCSAIAAEHFSVQKMCENYADLYRKKLEKNHIIEL